MKEANISQEHVKMVKASKTKSQEQLTGAQTWTLQSASPTKYQRLVIELPLFALRLDEEVRVYTHWIYLL